MGAKDNLNEAMYSMFGVGKAPSASEAPAAEENPFKGEPAAAAPTVQPAPLKMVTYLAPGSCMEGKLKCQGDVHIAGIFKGDIDADGKVLLCSNMSGNVKGDLDIKGNISLTANTSVEGNIVTGTMCMESGAIINGSLVMSRKN